MMRKLKTIADVAGKVICTPIIFVYAAVAFLWMELFFWWMDDMQYEHKALHYVKEYFLDIKECIADVWNDHFWNDTFFMKD